MLQAKIKRLSDEVELPKYHTSESAAFDLAASEDYVIKPGEIVKIKTGLVIEAPAGHFLLLSARSSLPGKKGLTVPNGIGVVDRDYSGPEDEVLILVRNFTESDVQVAKGERIAQGIFVKVDQVEWLESNTIRETSRAGFGSTGGYSEKDKVNTNL